MKTATQTQQPAVLVNPQIQLRNVKQFTGRDGYGLNASLYLNGKKIAFVLDEGNGGEMTFDADGKDFDERKANMVFIEQLKEYAKSLPKVDVSKTLIGLREDEKFMEMDLPMLIEELLAAEQKKKDQKKMEKKMQNAILVGVPNADSYRYFQYKINLSQIPLENLQRLVTEKIIPSLKEGEVILNTNLKELGVKY